MQARRAVTIALVLLAASWAWAQGDDLQQVLRFEAPHEGGTPHGWGGGPAGTLFADSLVVYEGEWSARIERDENSHSSFSTFTKRIPIDFGGQVVELRGYLRTEGVTEFAGLWLREDASSGAVAFDNMQQRGLKGSTEWTEYTIRLPLQKSAKELVFGFLLSGEGTVWADNLQILVDDIPVDQAPKAQRPETILDTDQEFDGGSGIHISELSTTQLSNLVKLGKLWGFLKYHHPFITSGQSHWDYELFRVLPRILEAGDQASANSILVDWIDSLAELGSCEPCAELSDDAQLLPELDWIADEQMLGRELSERLKKIHGLRPADGKQFYLSLFPGVGNADFPVELSYADLEFPDSGFQLLGLFRFWNIVAYWFPYRDIMDEDWDGVLKEFVPRIATAADKDSYELELMALIARIHDTHANLWSSLRLRPPRGDCQLPLVLRFVEGRAVLVGYGHGEKGPASGLKIGDVIEEIDGETVEELIESRRHLYAASNEAVQLRDMARGFLRGECGECELGIERDGETRHVRVERIPTEEIDPAAGRTHDLPGETFQLLSDQVAYLRMSSVEQGKAKNYIESAHGTLGLIIDIRNYPSEFMVFALGKHLVKERSDFALFTKGDLSNPGAFFWTEGMGIAATKPFYAGKVVILIDEATQSSAEYTTMAFRANPNSVVLGSTTAGADGNVSRIALPGGLQTMISGIGVFYPDKTPTQRVGIVPDIELRPTIQGIREGRDELLEAAIRLILGDDVPADEIESMLGG